MTDPLAAIVTTETLEPRIVRYADLKPCFNAFIDCRTPGSEAKENFTIIGPGVSENPAQHVHIAEPHGFNIGGARQPPSCVNSQHSHETAEVFVVHSGHWRFDLGEHGEDAQIGIGPGDVISVPPGMFRGFTNIGEHTAFLWAVLGQDDPGRVTWAPSVFEMARDFGLVLLETGQLIDRAAGEIVPADVAIMAPTSAGAAARLHRANAAQAAAMVVRHDMQTAEIIGRTGPLDRPHGFTLDRLALRPGDRHIVAARDEAEVVFVHSGALMVSCDDASAWLGPGDTMTIPVGRARTYAAAQAAIAFIVRGAA